MTKAHKPIQTIGRWLLRLIGPALLVIFLAKSDLGAITSAFGTMDLWPLALSLCLFPLFIGVKTWRWQLIMRELGLAPTPFGLAAALYTIGLYAGGITPGQSGDFIKGWYLQKRGLPLAPSLFSILIDRLFDLFIMALLAVIGLFTFADVFPAGVQPLIRIATLGFAALMALITPSLMARAPREWLLGLAARIAPARFRARIDSVRQQFAPLSLRPLPLVRLLLATAASASSTMLRIWLLYFALRLSIPLLEVIGSTALIAILQALPISVAGIGVRDAVLVALLGRHGYAAEQAISLSALFLLLNIEHILLGFLVSLRYPLAAADQPSAQ